MSDAGYVFTVTSNPSFCTVWAETERARAWFLEWTEGELLPTGEGHAVEYRYIRDLCNACSMLGSRSLRTASPWCETAKANSCSNDFSGL